MIPWRESFQLVHTWKPEEPSTGMFYSELCNGIPNFAFHIHTLSKGRGEKKADIEALGHSSAVCKKEKGVVAFLLSLCYCLFRNNTSPLRIVWNWNVSPGTTGRAGTREEEVQLYDGVTMHAEALEALRLLDSPGLPWFLLTLTQGTALNHNWAYITLKPPENPAID